MLHRGGGEWGVGQILPEIHEMLRDMVNKWTVRIPLECFLVSKKLTQ